jgi:hypothetical protein
MEYVVVAVIVLIVVAIGVTLFVVSATRRQRPAAIAAPDDKTPLGDTDQHAGEQTAEGRTVDQPEQREPAEPDTPESPRLANREP